jgi:predicted transcriptional regulator
MVNEKSPVQITARLVAAYASNNRMMPQDLPVLIQTVHAALMSLHNGGHDGGGGEPQKPAVPIKKSVTGDYIICLEDGLKFKSLKRHLRSSYKMTPEEYREVGLAARLSHGGPDLCGAPLQTREANWTWSKADAAQIGIRRRASFPLLLCARSQLWPARVSCALLR